MKHGAPTDYLAPFSDVPAESDDARVDRVVAIGLAPLCEWWGRVKDDTNPGTYGGTRHEFAADVAYLASGGRCARGLADESAPRFTAVRKLGAAINWT